MMSAVAAPTGFFVSDIKGRNDGRGAARHLGS
jgi:hypothetical protein